MENTPAPRRIFVDPNARPTKVIDGVTFIARIMNVRQFEERKDSVRYTDDAGKIQVRAGTWTLETLRRGLVGWEGDLAPDFLINKKGQPTDETLTRLHPDIRRELANWIEEVNTPGDEDVKD